jgi:tetratricopeptide (TPR) repeat protein
MNAHFLRGQVLLRQQRYKDAVGQLQLALSEEPDNGLLHALMANALLRCDRWQLALNSATTALTKDPACAFAFWIMAMVRLERRQFAEAEQAIESAIELEPDDAANHGVLSRLHYERRDYSAALEAANAGLASGPSDDLCLTFRSRALMALGRANEARSDANTLLADDPDDSWNHCLRGDQLLAEGDYNGARRHYLEALRIDSHNAAARYGLAVSLKARSPIYSLLLRGLLGVDRYSGRALWFVVIVILVGMRLGDRWTNAHPEWLVPYEAAKALLWGAAIVLFLANPVFDLVLRFGRESRHVLTEDEIKATNWYLVCFGFAALCGVWAATGNMTLLARTLGVTALYLTRAVDETFEATPGYVRRRMATLSAVAGGGVVLTPVILFAGVFWLGYNRELQMLPRFVFAVSWDSSGHYALHRLCRRHSAIFREASPGLG